MSVKKSVAILFGGKSVEHQISINSAKNVFEYIDKEQFEPILIGISTEGKWFLKKMVDGKFSKEDEINLILDPERKGFYHVSSNKEIIPDVIFPVLHGTDGEDGSIQGLLKVIDVPFIGTNVLGSAISMSKLYSKKLLESESIPVSKYISYEFEDKHLISYREVVDRMGLPVMAKAANLGSSVGVHKVTTEENFNEALDDVFKFDSTIIFEEYIEGRELECAVIGNEYPEASRPGEITVSSNYDFYTYEAKYLDADAAKLHVPADINEDISEKIQALSIRSYKALKCQDFARVDLFLKEGGEILINEINTIPGFTNSSMFPMMWKDRGLEFTPLITKLVNMALDRYEKSKRISKQYNSNQVR